MDDKKLNELRKGDDVVVPGGQLPTEPSWLDREKYNHARKVYSKYFASINFSHLCGLLLSLYFSKNIITLKSTGNSNSTPSLIRRYLATIRHIQSWYEGDIWDPQSPSRKSLASVRSMHHRAATKMAERKDGVVYVSQWDMTLTQWGFIGPILLFPSKTGMHGCSEKDFDALVHFWRCIVYALGVDEEFNLCAGSLSEVTETCRSVLDKEYRIKLSEANPSSVAMCKSVMEAMRNIENGLTWGSMSTYIHEMMDVPYFLTMGLLDYFFYYVIYFTMAYLSRIAIVRVFLNFQFRMKLDKADKEKVTKKEEKMKLISQVSSG